MCPKDIEGYFSFLSPQNFTAIESVKFKPSQTSPIKMAFSTLNYSEH